MYTMDFAYDGPIFLVPLSPSYPSSPVFENIFFVCGCVIMFVFLAGGGGGGFCLVWLV